MRLRRTVRLLFVQPLRRFAPAPLVGEPLAKRRGFTVCQGLSYKERWHCEAMTERLDKGEAAHERKTQKVGCGIASAPERAIHAENTTIRADFIYIL